jgi:formate hydrogenlyase transcriptional activator
MGAKTGQKATITVSESLAEQNQTPREALLDGDGCWQREVENSVMGIAVADLTGRFLAANAAYQKMLGYTEEELRVLPFLNTTHPNDGEANSTLVRELLEGRREQVQIEKRHRRKDGSLIWIRNQVSVVPSAEKGPCLLMSIVDDITERKQTEEQLQAKKAHLEELFEQSPGAVALFDRNHRVVWINKEFTRLFGYLQEEAVGRELLDLTIPTELPEEVQRYHDLINRRERVEAEAIRRRKDGTLLHVSILGVGISAGCGQVATYAIYQDITERKRLEEKIRNNERELRLQTEVIPQHIWSALPDGSVDYCNQGLLAYFGLTMEELRLAGTNFIHPDDRDRVHSAWHEAMSQGKAYEAEARLLGSDGQYRWFLERALPLCDAEGQIIKWYGTNTDIEDRKRAENELQRSRAYLVEGERLSHTGSWAWNVATRQSYWSEETFRIFGFDPAKTKPSFEMFLQRVHPEDRPKLEQEFNGMTIDTKDGVLDFRIVLPDGSIKYIHAEGHAVLSESGEVTEQFGVHVDMTEQYQARAALEKAYEEINGLKDQLYKENLALARERDHLRLLLEVNNVVVSTLDLQELLGAISGCLRSIVQHDYASLALYEPENQQLRVHALDFAAGKGLMQESMLVPVECTPPGLAFSSHQPVLVNQLNSQQFPSELTNRLIAVGLKSGCCVPLISPGRVSGVLNVASLRENAFTQADVELLSQVANQVAIAIENFLSLYQIVELHNKLADEKLALEEAYAEISKLKDQLYNENLALREEIDQASMFEEIVGSSPALQRVLANVAKVAPTDSTVLITGDTGTGKELIARAIHKRSHRSERAFVKVNCAALPASLIGSELFGHEKGAFTGALQRRLGRFELAEGGSIFLDEIGDLPAETQIALLRVLQEREFERIGGGEAIATDVRVIAATHRDLKAAAAAGSFRADLYYRLNVFPIAIPPLRERLEDIPLLVEYFIGRYANQAGKKIRNIHKKTLELFQSYAWPGNLRELQNVIERSVILCEGDTLSVDHSWLAKESDSAQQVSRPLTETLMDQEKEIIESALAASKGRVAGPSGAAAKVGMPPSTLEARIKALKIDKKRFNSG